MTSDHTVQQGSEEIRVAQQRSLHRSRPPIEIPGYDAEQFLGSGAFGEVWVATERNTGRRVAIKFYSHRGGLDWTLLSREVEKLAFLFADRYVVQLIDVGWNADPPYYVMEYLENGSVAELLESGPLPVDLAVSLFRDVAVGLVHSHGKGVLHCDLKPANILLDQDHKPRLADFGQSRLSHEQTPALGTLFYMAPEQADLAAVPDARWDVYALGALLYCMLTGEPPYRTDALLQRIDAAETLEEKLVIYSESIRRAHRPTAHRRVPGVDGDLASIIDRCLTPNLDKRFANAQAVLDALDLRTRRHAARPLIVLGAVGPLILLGVMSAFAWLTYNTAVDQSDAALTRRAIETNAFAAQFVAETVASQVDRRWQALEQVAADPRFRQLVAAGVDQPLDSEPRRQLQQFLEQRHDHYSDLQTTSWFVDDVRGYQRARSPFSNATIDRDFSGRDYFHGQGKEFPEGTNGLMPLRHLHRSLAFKSQATGRPMVAFSAPIWDDPEDLDERQTIGVLAFTVELGEFAELRRETGTATEQIAVLVDTRPDEFGRAGRILEHPYLAELADRHVIDAPAAYLDPATTRRLEQLRQWKRKPMTARESPETFADLHFSAEYRDPFGGEYDGRWLAAFQPVRVPGRSATAGDTGWTVIVQERYQAAVEPARQLGASLFRFGALALTSVVVVVALLWGFVIVVLSGSRLHMVNLLRQRVGLPATSLVTGAGSSRTPSGRPPKPVGSMADTEG